MTTIINGSSPSVTFSDSTTQASAYVAAGSVIQVVNATYGTTTTSTSGSFVNTGLTATITPKFSTSKILVLIDQVGVGKLSGNTTANFALLRNSTIINYFESFSGYTATTGTSFIGACSTNYLDSPATTSAITYKTQMQSGDGVTTIYANATNGTASTSTITLMEIAQ